MLAKQQYSAVLYASLLGSFIHRALAVPTVQFATCITSCIRQGGCPPTDVDCLCEKASGHFLLDVVVCMNQWCSADTKLGDLIDPIASSCDVPKSAIEAAEAKAGFDTGSISTTKAMPTGAAKGEEPTTTSLSVGQQTIGPASKGILTLTESSLPSITSALLADTTIAPHFSTVSESLLLASSTTFASVTTTTATATVTDSDDPSGELSSQGFSGGSPADSAPAGNTAAVDKTSPLAAVLAIAAVITFGC
ncbi:hypothetical protein GGR54DRAFT_87211 [Hypoxylon sp. NC1633]|nr:hypothetical protein GGR54DRAFT_87211 [Hypoxylon sp. NC1633]